MLIFTMITDLMLKIHKSVLWLNPERNIYETSESHSSKREREEIWKVYWTLICIQLEPLGPYSSLQPPLSRQHALFPQSRSSHQCKDSAINFTMVLQTQENPHLVPINKRDHCVDHSWKRALRGGSDFPKAAKRGQKKNIEIEEVNTWWRHSEIFHS